MDLNCSICRIASNRVPLPCSSPNFHLDATKSNANIKKTKILSYTKIHTYCVKKGLRRTANKRIHQKKHKKYYVSVNPQFVFITRNIWSFRLPHLYILSFLSCTYFLFALPDFDWNWDLMCEDIWCWDRI